MGQIQAPYFPRQIGTYAFGYSVFFYLFFLIFNTSFTIMGVDVGDFLKQYLGAFFGVYLITTTKVFLVSFFVHLSLFSIAYIPFKIFGTETERYRILLFFAVFGFEILVLFQSFVLYPQIYGEFFFFRYPGFAGLLYFLTDHTNSFIFQILYTLVLVIVFGSIFYSLYRKKIKEGLFLLLHLLLLGFLHNHGSYLIGIIYFVLLLWQNKNYQNVHLKTYIGGIIFILFLFVFPLFFDGLTGFFRSGSVKNPPLIILSADSLRYDKVGQKINGESITPNIDKLLSDGIFYHDHHTTIPRTFPSWADLLTGKYSMSHKIRDMFPALEEQKRIGSNEFPTIFQILKTLGYQNYAIGSFAADIFPRANFGFDGVFAPNFNAKIMTLQRTAESQILLLPFLTGTVFGGGMYLSEIDGLSTWGDGSRLVDRFKKVCRFSGDSNFSITYFSSVIHFPYSPAYPHYKRYTNKDYYGKYKYLKFVDPTDSKSPTESEISQIRGLFDSAVFAFDEEVGEILSYLKDKDLYDKSIIILTADHGEALYEDVHGQGHGEHLRGEAVTRVPLIIKFPKDSNLGLVTNTHFYGITSSVDIYPTILDYLKMPTKQELPGISLLNTIGKTDWDFDRLVYAETGIWFSDMGDHFFQKQRIPYPNILNLHQVVPEEDYQIMITDPIYRETIAFAKHRSIQSKNFKLIYIPTREGVKFEFYDRIKDPLNKNNLYPNHYFAKKLKDSLYETVVRWEEANVAGEYLIPSPISNINENSQ
ncbi:sulfatase-like hydrolase/transferase [Leptospira sp. 96542]|nr:sulfatase-like hydrolase/transferase [Leptospira sp. 96542]